MGLGRQARVAPSGEPRQVDAEGSGEPVRVADPRLGEAELVARDGSLGAPGAIGDLILSEPGASAGGEEALGERRHIVRVLARAERASIQIGVSEFPCPPLDFYSGMSNMSL